MVDSDTIRQAAALLLGAAPGSQVILFGSHARGDAGPDSDVDFLVVEPTLRSRREEMVRLRQVLRPLRIPVDVLVVSERVFDEWRDAPSTLIYDAAREGQEYQDVDTAAILEAIEINPRVCGGKPVIRGTRIPVTIILDRIADGQSCADIRKAFPELTPRDVQAAVLYARTAVALTPSPFEGEGRGEGRA